jgi:hypothetical protein
MMRLSSSSNAAVCSSDSSRLLRRWRSTEFFAARRCRQEPASQIAKTIALSCDRTKISYVIG